MDFGVVMVDTDPVSMATVIKVNFTFGDNLYTPCRLPKLHDYIYRE